MHGQKPADRFQSANEAARALTVGRMSGPQESITAARVAAAVQADAATAVVPTAARAAARPSAPTTPMPRAAHAPAVPRSLWALLGIPVVVLLAVGGVAGYMMFGRAEIVVANRLAEPIRVSAGSGAERTVDPGTDVTIMPGSEGVRWWLVRPVTPEGSAMGLELSGVLLPQGRGTTRREIQARGSGLAWFSPLITNASDRPLTVTVNAGLQGSASCGCTIPPGATRMRIGYYPLFGNSTVRVEDRSGRSAMFGDLGVEVEPATGLVALRFENKDLRR